MSLTTVLDTREPTQRSSMRKQTTSIALPNLSSFFYTYIEILCKSLTETIESHVSNLYLTPLIKH